MANPFNNRAVSCTQRTSAAGPLVGKQIVLSTHTLFFFNMLKCVATTNLPHIWPGFFSLGLGDQLLVFLKRRTDWSLGAELRVCWCVLPEGPQGSQRAFV